MPNYKYDADYVYSGFLIPFDEIKKVVPNEVKMFEEKAESVLVYLRLTYPDKNFTMKDIFEMCSRDDKECCRIYDELIERKGLKDIEKQLDEVYRCLLVNGDSVFSAFRKETNVAFDIGFDYENGDTYFSLCEKDVIELTPQAKSLKEKGIDFKFKVWTETY